MAQKGFNGDPVPAEDDSSAILANDPVGPDPVDDVDAMLDEILANAPVGAPDPNQGEDVEAMLDAIIADAPVVNLANAPIPNQGHVAPVAAANLLISSARSALFAQPQTIGGLRIENLRILPPEEKHVSFEDLFSAESENVEYAALIDSILTAELRLYLSQCSEADFFCITNPVNINQMRERQTVFVDTVLEILKKNIIFQHQNGLFYVPAEIIDDIYKIFVFLASESTQRANLNPYYCYYMRWILMGYLGLLDLKNDVNTNFKVHPPNKHGTYLPFKFSSTDTLLDRLQMAVSHLVLQCTIYRPYTVLAEKTSFLGHFEMVSHLEKAPRLVALRVSTANCQLNLCNQTIKKCLNNAFFQSLTSVLEEVDIRQALLTPIALPNVSKIFIIRSTVLPQSTYKPLVDAFNNFFRTTFPENDGFSFCVIQHRINTAGKMATSLQSLPVEHDLRTDAENAQHYNDRRGMLFHP